MSYRMPEDYILSSKSSCTYSTLRGDGWTDDQLIAEGYLIPRNRPSAPTTTNKYNRVIIGMDGTHVTVDVYRVLDAFAVTDPCLQHLIKKALCVGVRGHKDVSTDLNDILLSAEKAVELNNQRIQGEIE